MNHHLESVTDELTVVERSSRIVRFGCGHQYSQQFKVNFYGRVHALDRSQLLSRLMCGDCVLHLVRKYFRRCGYCGHVIKVDDAISLLPITSEEEKKKPGVVVIESLDDSVQYLMGCMDPACTKQRRYFFGYWRKGGFDKTDFEILCGESVMDLPQEDSRVRILIGAVQQGHQCEDAQVLMA